MGDPAALPVDSYTVIPGHPAASIRRKETMARSNSPEALTRRGFSIGAVKQWREREHESGRPSGLDDFYRAHQICVECGGHGSFVTGVRWRDTDGIQRTERGPVALLVQRHGLDDPTNWLSDVLKWDYLNETCGFCGGSGRLGTAGEPKVKPVAESPSVFPTDLLDQLTGRGQP